MNSKQIEEGMKMILKGIGLDLTDQHLVDTPSRVARAYAEIFSGLDNTEEQVEKILSTSFSSDIDEMILVKDILVFSMCPHHFLPVVYHVDIAYIPNGRVLGLSKLPRIAEVLAKRPVIQEDITVDIAEALMKIGALGVAVRVRGDHFCMKMRGEKKPDSSVITSCMKGVFLEDQNTRNEFLRLLCKD